ncbi:MAG: hypothetical protein KBC16_01350 [Candidatus Pacebacteria bacterium]|nr:hypothetical protein [Candidatus Paceibacterota bacterium]
MSLDHSLMLKERDGFLSHLESSEDPRVIHARIVGMATALQMTLSLPNTRKVLTRAQALECIMRAVTAEAQGDEGRKEFVEHKLRAGAQMLGVKL